MITKKNMKILVVSPHISDGVMMCGASMARLVEEKHIVYVMSLGPNAHVDVDNEVKASKIIGFQVVHPRLRLNVGEYTAGQCYTEILAKIKDLTPDVVVTVSAKEVQYDHQVTYLATRNAVYYAPREVYWESEIEYRPRMYVTDCIESFKFVRADSVCEVESRHLLQKKEAMKVYDYVPEAGKGPHFDVVHDRDWVQALGTLRGLWTGFPYAEVFQREEI